MRQKPEGHEHAWSEDQRHENEDRIRTRDVCACGAVRYGCFAKRLADEPDQEGNREAWGPVDGEWHYSIKEPET